MMNFLFLIPIGLLVGAFGTLIGAGGGFILVPVLLLLYPHEKADVITGISLAVVFFNSLSGSITYARLKKIDYKSGIIFAIATLPGSIIGSLVTSYVPRRMFNKIFGIMMVIIGVFLMLKKGNNEKKELKGKKNYTTRTLIDADGVKYVYSYNPTVGIALSVIVGFISSFLGIGGGIIHVPALVNLLNFPVHIATATSHFILVMMSLSGSLVHLFSGVLTPGFLKIAALAIGVVFGAPIGAKLSKRLKGEIIIKSLAAALALAGIRIFLMAL